MYVHEKLSYLVFKYCILKELAMKGYYAVGLAMNILKQRQKHTPPSPYIDKAESGITPYS